MTNFTIISNHYNRVKSRHSLLRGTTGILQLKPDERIQIKWKNMCEAHTTQYMDKENKDLSPGKCQK